MGAEGIRKCLSELQLSAKGSCFYNNYFDTELGMFVCADVLDITECAEIFKDTSCIYARKHTFQNLESNSSISPAVFLCLWDVENKTCRSKKLDAIDIVPKSKNSFTLTIVFVIIGVCAVNFQLLDWQNKGI
jgi:hypothetical protein